MGPGRHLDGPLNRDYYQNGTAAAFVSYDSPDVLVFLEKDLSALYTYYGAYPSWVEIGTGSAGEGWLPVSIVPYSSSAVIDYTNVLVSGQYVYQHQSFFKLSVGRAECASFAFLERHRGPATRKR